MQLKQHKLNGNGGLKRGLLNVTLWWGEGGVYVSKRAVFLGEHANKTVTVFKCLRHTVRLIKNVFQFCDTF